MSIQYFKENKVNLDCREDTYQECSDKIQDLLAPWALFWTTNVSVKKSVFIEVGMFDEEFITWGVEDVELAYRLYKNKVHFKVARKACGIHYPHGREDSENGITNNLNRLLLFKKHPDLVIEFYSKCETSIQFINDYKSFSTDYLTFMKRYYLDRQSEEDSKLISTVKDKKLIVLGAHDVEFIKQCSNCTCLEINYEFFEKAKSEIPKLRIMKLFGVNTPFTDQFFEHAIIEIGIDVLPYNFLECFMTEVKRIASIVHIKSYQGIVK